jgi:DNA-binding response OmpR family regulator
VSVDGCSLKEEILVATHDDHARELITYLQREHYKVHHVKTASACLHYSRRNIVDLIVLDDSMPDMPGWEVLSQLKRAGGPASIPVVILSDKEDDESMVKSLELGAEAHMVKPLWLRLVLAHLKAILRARNRTSIRERAFLGNHHIVIDIARHQAYLDDNPLNLSPSEFRTLEVLVRDPGRVLSRSEILELADGPYHKAMDRTVDFRVFSLRKKLGKAANLVQSVTGLGYKLTTKL